MDFWIFIMIILVAIGGFVVGYAAANRDWLDHAFYGSEKRIEDKSYKITEVKKRTI
jgi:hypothetical protein